MIFQLFFDIVIPWSCFISVKDSFSCPTESLLLPNRHPQHTYCVPDATRVTRVSNMVCTPRDITAAFNKVVILLSLKYLCFVVDMLKMGGNALGKTKCMLEVNTLGLSTFVQIMCWVKSYFLTKWRTVHCWCTEEQGKDFRQFTIFFRLFIKTPIFREYLCTRLRNLMDDRLCITQGLTENLFPNIDDT